MKLTDEELNRIMAKADDDLDRLKDRCHELYEENQKLKESRDWWKDRFFGQQVYDDSYRITCIEYKRRIDEALQCIEEIWKDTEHKNLLSIIGIGLLRTQLLKILQGEKTNGND